MTVYVDDMYKYPIGQFRRMKMSHLLADSPAELLAMVDKIGVARKWIQHPGRHDEHFDIAMSKREAALAAGAVAITYPQASCMSLRRRVTGALGKPEDAETWRQDYFAQREAEREAGRAAK